MLSIGYTLIFLTQLLLPWTGSSQCRGGRRRFRSVAFKEKKRVAEMRILIPAMILGLSVGMMPTAYAVDPINHKGLEPVPEPPEIPAPVKSGQTLEPEVTIVQKKGKTLEEYRIHGQLYMVKVTPAVGPSYYLIDKNGDGTMDVRMSSLYHDFVVPQWVIFSW